MQYLKHILACEWCRPMVGQENTCDEEQDQEDVQAGTNSVGSDSAWVRRRLSDSIYLWACGEKADDVDDEPKLSDRLIGWLILLMQGFAYTTLIVLAGSSSNSDTDTSGESGYLLPSVTGAMYLLVASTTHDLLAGFSLLVDGSRASHRAFGIGLLVVYGIMIAAAMTVLVSTSSNSASLVLNAVTVLFIADLDEKALKFLLTVPQKWRLFWAIESIGISFALALVAVVSIGDDSPLLEGDNGVLKQWPTWFIWVLNPAAVTLSSVLLSFTLQAVCEFFTEACVGVEEPTVGVVVTRTFARLFVAVMRAKERVKEDYYFLAALAVWLAQAVHSWSLFVRGRGFPVALYFASSSAGNGDEHLVVENAAELVLPSNVILAIGLVMKAVGVFQRRHELATAIPETRYSQGGCWSRGRWGSCAESRVPSLLVGWGIGYWIVSLLYLLVCSWQGSGCGWYNAPSVVIILSYLIVPCFLTASVFMVADADILGTRFGAFVKPAVDRMRNTRRVEYWIMASVFRDFLVLWIAHCEFLSYDLRYYE